MKSSSHQADDRDQFHKYFLIDYANIIAKKLQKRYCRENSIETP